MAKKKADREKITTGALYHLSPQELKFVQGVAAGMTGTAAVQAAGYRTDGQRGKARAHQLMKKPLIQAALYDLTSKAWEQAGITVNQVIQQTAEIAFLPRELLDGKPTFNNKVLALKLLSEQMKILDRKKPGQTPENSVIALILKAARGAVTDVVGGGGSSGSQGVPAVEGRTD